MIRVLWVLLLLAGCRSDPVPTRFEGCAMTIPYCVQIGDKLSSTQTAEIQKLIIETFAEVHGVYNNWNPDSEVAKLGKLPAHQSIELSESLARFLSFVDAVVDQTEGRFDPTVELLQRVWKKSLNAGEIPDQNQLSPLVQATGWKHIHLEGRSFWKDEDLTAIDLGGVAKGYAVDLITERLGLAGYGSIYVEWGGEIRTMGQHPTNRSWKIGIEGLSAIELKNEAIATSGNYIQNWTVEGLNYTHIIDPFTGEPLHSSPISSVSVIAPTCAEADALATALMLFPSKEAAEAWAESRGFRIYIW